VLIRVVVRCAGDGKGPAPKCNLARSRPAFRIAATFCFV